jgi:hypothetical protein
MSDPLNQIAEICHEQPDDALSQIEKVLLGNLVDEQNQRIAELEQQLANTAEKLRNPAAVLANILRGTIVLPDGYGRTVELEQQLAAARRDQERWRKLEQWYAACHFYPEKELDLDEGIALIFIAPKSLRISADLGATIDAAIAARESGK